MYYTPTHYANYYGLHYNISFYRFLDLIAIYATVSNITRVFGVSHECL